MTQTAIAQEITNTKGRPPASLRSPEETRRNLLSAALDVFVEHGYAGASIKAIARRAGVTSGTIYCHFDNKAELLIEGIKEEVASQTPLTPSLTGAGNKQLGIDDLTQIVSEFATSRMVRARRLSLELHAAAAKETAVAGLHLAWNQQSHAKLCALLELAVAQGIVSKDLQIAQTAHLFHALILGLSHLETLDPSLIDNETWIDYLNSSVRTLLLG